MSALYAAIAAADEAYLCALSNKGLYKRALRELPEAGVAVRLEGETVSASFADGVTLSIEGSIPSYRCSCPSRSVCKHLLMAVLAAQIELAAQAGEQGSGEEGEEAPPPAAPDFSAIAGMGAGELEKLAGKRNFKNAVLAVQLGEGCNIEEGSTLRITLTDSGNSVLFLPGTPAETAGCSCKSPDFCAHRAQAVVQYIKYKKGRLPGEFLPDEEEAQVEFSAYTLPYIRQFVIEVMDTGLARLSQDSPGRFLQLATICHGQRLANLERLCSRISGQLEHYIKGSASFNRDYVISDLCRLLELCDRIGREGGSRDTVGVFRETYRPVARMELWGLGAWGWHSAGGYTGVSVLYYSPERQGMLTYTSALPDAVSPGVEKIYQQGAPWGLQTKLSAITHARLALKGGKVSGRGQLSASAGATATSLGGFDPARDEALAHLRYNDFDRLLEALWRHGEEENEGPMTALLLPARTGASSYDEIEQRWTLPLYDAAERRLLLRVGYEASTALLLDNLAHFEKRGKLWQPLLARVSLEGGELVAFPVTLYGEEPFNLSVDQIKQAPGKKKGSLFNWGDH